MPASNARLVVRPALVLVALVAAVPALAQKGAPAEKPIAPIADASLALARPESFAAAVTAIERATGATGERFDLPTGKSVPLMEGRSFALDARTASRLLAGSHGSYRKAGYYLFRYDRGFGLPGEKDFVGLLATADPDVVIRKIGTSGAHRGVTTEQIIAFLHALEKEEAFEVMEVGTDFISGRFERTPKDTSAIVRRVVQFAPDLVKGHSDPTSGLTDLIGRKRTLYLIWD
jgi:Domain of unknown function (DUF4253)